MARNEHENEPRERKRKFRFVLYIFLVLALLTSAPSLTLVRENNELDIEISSFFIIIYCVLLTYYDIM